MATEPAPAEIASPACGVYLAYDAPAGKVAVRRLDHLAHELVAKYSSIVHVAARELDIGTAYSGQPHFNDALARTRPRIRTIGSYAQLVIEYQGAHRVSRCRASGERL
jgi:hypothetical protein